MNLDDAELGSFSRQDVIENEPEERKITQRVASERVIRADEKETRGNSLGDVLREVTVLPSLHVETLDFLSRRSIGSDLDSGVLLLLEKEKSLEDGVEVDFEESVLVVDLLLEDVGHLDRLAVVGDVRVDEDGIGISVDDLDEKRPVEKSARASRREEKEEESLTSS